MLALADQKVALQLEVPHNHQHVDVGQGRSSCHCFLFLSLPVVTGREYASGQRPQLPGVILRDVTRLFPATSFWVVWRRGQRLRQVDRLLIRELERAAR